MLPHLLRRVLPFGLLAAVAVAAGIGVGYLVFGLEDSGQGQDSGEDSLSASPEFCAGIAQWRDAQQRFQERVNAEGSRRGTGLDAASAQFERQMGSLVLPVGRT